MILLVAGEWKRGTIKEKVGSSESGRTWKVSYLFLAPPKHGGLRKRLTEASRPSVKVQDNSDSDFSDNFKKNEMLLAG